MLILGTKNTASQAVLTDGTITIGNVYRKYCKPTRTGLPTFASTNQSITLNADGIYHITATFVGSGTTAGVVTIQLLENGEPVTGVISSETITTADTELRTFVIDYYILVDSACVLNFRTTRAKTISFENTGVGATFTSVIVNAEKVV